MEKLTKEEQTEKLTKEEQTQLLINFLTLGVISFIEELKKKIKEDEKDVDC